MFHLVDQHYLIQMDMSSFPKKIQFKKKVLPQSQLLRCASWFSQWTFDVNTSKEKESSFHFLSRTQCQISTIVPMIYIISPESSSHESLMYMIITLRQRIQEKLLDNILVYNRVETLHGFLRLYIHVYV